MNTTLQQAHLKNEGALVGLVMGSHSDWQTMKEAADMLTELHIAFESDIVSAHRTPDKLFQYAETAAVRGLQVLIAGAGGAAHLPGMLAAKTILPVLGVPIESQSLKGLDSLYSIVQMPKGIPVGTLAIGTAGAANAALLAASILALHDYTIRHKLENFRQLQTQNILATSLPQNV
ncbi:MAG: 5-(carboxyamino)imidazole ribonucleotide mutase [Rickettsiella sp.]|nr:5-(carboxyamino)imidazole ribonucleotide mutase [Rickettsiella sp.]